MIWVIIPTFNEEQALPDTLDTVWRQSEPFRVIVVDGGSTDRTPKFLHQDPRITGMTASKGRALQMNAGAQCAISLQASDNDWLLFLHADTHLPAPAFEYLHQLSSDSSCLAGGFRHQFSGQDWRLRMISRLDNIRCSCSHIIYGDQALFVRVGLFFQLGGFPSQPMLEDVAFGELLLSQTTPRLLSLPVVTDSRKFIKMGVWRSFVRALLIILHAEFRLPTLSRVFFQDVR